MLHLALAVVFDEEFEHVLLVHKNRPAFLRGTFNGPGGKLEEDDLSPAGCIARETQEESGLLIPADSWTLFCELTSDEKVVTCHVATAPKSTPLETEEDEPVDWHPLDQLPTPLSPNMDWLIPLAKRHLTERGIHFVRCELDSSHETGKKF